MRLLRVLTWVWTALDVTLGAHEADDQRTAQCLSSVRADGAGGFAWGEASGTCHDVRRSFGLCDHHPPRECLLARVPWQTPLSVVRCCFHCCMHSWQRRLGLVDVFNHWWENPRFEDSNFQIDFDK